MWPSRVCEMDAAAERKGVAVCNQGCLDGATPPSCDSFVTLQTLLPNPILKLYMKNLVHIHN